MKRALQVFVLLLFILMSNLSVKAQRLAITEYYKTSYPGRHYYATNSMSTNQAPTGSGWVTQGIIGYLENPIPYAPGYGTMVYEYTSNGSYYYTNDINRHPSGWTLRGVLGLCVPSPAQYPVYEFYSNGDYYYSRSPVPFSSDWGLNGIAYYCNASWYD